MQPTPELVRRRRRNRDREGAGKSDHSWIKQGMVGKIVGAQVGAFRQSFPETKMVLVDGNAGDGLGVELEQGCLFGTNLSRPTPLLLAELSECHNTTLCLCDEDREKRASLRSLFPAATIFGSHREVADFVLREGFGYVLWLSDPCGPKGQGVDAMCLVATRVRRSDFVIVLNEHTLNQFESAAHSPFWAKHQKYVPMREPMWWLGKLAKRYLARTSLVKQSPRFHFRVLIISNWIADGVRRMRKVEIIERDLK
jgi:hypothetical protein